MTFNVRIHLWKSSNNKSNVLKSPCSCCIWLIQVREPLRRRHWSLQYTPKSKGNEPKGNSSKGNKQKNKKQLNYEKKRKMATSRALNRNKLWTMFVNLWKLLYCSPNVYYYLNGNSGEPPCWVFNNLNEYYSLAGLIDEPQKLLLHPSCVQTQHLTSLFDRSTPLERPPFPSLLCATENTMKWRWKANSHIAPHILYKGVLLMSTAALFLFQSWESRM